MTFDDYHFDAAEFDALLTAHGTPALVRNAMRCACWNIETGQPDPACMSCYPFGYLWDAAESMTLFGPNRKPTRRIEAQGSFDTADAFFTFPTGKTPPHFTRFTLPKKAEIVVDDILTKGREDTIRFATVTEIIKAHYSTRTPPTGHPYTVASVPLVEGTDFTVDAGTKRKVTFVGPGAALADGTRYTIQFKAHAEYVVWEPQDRNEGGNAMPYRYLCKRLDFLVHAKGPDDATQADYEVSP